MKHLATERLELEPIQSHHAAALYEGLSDVDLYRYLDEKPPVSMAALERRFTLLQNGCSPDGTQLWLNWALRDRATDRYLGYVQATVAGGEASIAYVLFGNVRGCGFAREAVIGMMKYLEGDLGVRRLTATTDEANAASANLLQQLGFEPNAEIDRSGSTVVWSCVSELGAKRRPAT